MKTEFKCSPQVPYSLHDMRVREIKINEDRVLFIFEYGYVKLAEPYNQVEGTITIEGADFDFTSVCLQSSNGEYGKFQGEKLKLTEFLNKYNWNSFEIVDELYGYNQVIYSGFFMG